MFALLSEFCFFGRLCGWLLADLLATNREYGFQQPTFTPHHFSYVTKI
jgi:hypothetical protein